MALDHFNELLQLDSGAGVGAAGAGAKLLVILKLDSKTQNLEEKIL